MIWARSQDRELKPIGATTGIHYQAAFETYLKIILRALNPGRGQRPKKWVTSLFREWDRVIFKEEVSKFGGGKVTGIEGMLQDEENAVLKSIEDAEAESEEEDPVGPPRMRR